MVALADIDQITRARTFMLPAIQKVEKDIVDRFERSGATSLVNGIRAVRIYGEIISVGMLSLYEAALRDEFGWNKPFDEMKALLDRKGDHELAETFHDIVLAINVLKHGTGRSYDALLERGHKVAFQVKGRDEPFFEEGDVSEGSSLVLVDDSFVNACADAIEATRLASVEKSG